MTFNLATATIPFPTATRQAAVIVPTKLPSRTPRPTAPPGQYVFLGNLPKNPNPAPTPDPLPVDPNLLTGMAAVTAAASATATSLFMRRKREEELRRIADESRAEAEARARAVNRQRIITNLQNQERMANPDKYRNVSTDQIPFDERKVAYNEGFISAVKAGLIKPEKVSKAVAETKKKLLERQVSTIILNSIREGRSPSKYWVVRNGKAYPKLAAFQDGGDKEFPIPDQISQYTYEIWSAYGANGCGLVSICEAISTLTKGNTAFLDCITEIKDYAFDNGYSKENGIQPDELFSAVSKYLYDNNIEIEASVPDKIISDFNQGLKNLRSIQEDSNKVAILDLMLYTDQYFTLIKSENGKSFAHFVFLREIGNDYVIVSETLSPGGGLDYSTYIKQNNNYPHIKIDFESLQEIWFNPETRADYKVTGSEEIGYWFMQLERIKPDATP